MSHLFSPSISKCFAMALIAIFILSVSFLADSFFIAFLSSSVRGRLPRFLEASFFSGTGIPPKAPADRTAIQTFTV